MAKRRARFVSRRGGSRVTRYDNLCAALDELHAAGVPKLRYLEVGTYDGRRAADLIARWRMMPGARHAIYYGFDLWEDLTPERSEAEHSKPKLPPSQGEVSNRIFAAGAEAVRLYKGDTRERLPQAVRGIAAADLIFIDGGHSLETVQSDWDALLPLIRRSPAVFLDDYYENRDDFGCRRLVSDLPQFEVALLDPIDYHESSGLGIRMVRVRARQGA